MLRGRVPFIFVPNLVHLVFQLLLRMQKSGVKNDQKVDFYDPGDKIRRLSPLKWGPKERPESGFEPETSCRLGYPKQESYH